MKEHKDREEAVKRYVALKNEMKLFQKQLDEWRALPGKDLPCTVACEFLHQYAKPDSKAINYVIRRSRRRG